MSRDLAYDMMLEVQGLIRSLALRTSLDRELHIGDTFDMRGRRWVVTGVHPGSVAGVDRRLTAREVEVPDGSPLPSF
jgi:hypothetical protein